MNKTTDAINVLESINRVWTHAAATAIAKRESCTPDDLKAGWLDFANYVLDAVGKPDTERTEPPYAFKIIRSTPMELYLALLHLLYLGKNLREHRTRKLLESIFNETAHLIVVNTPEYEAHCREAAPSPETVQ